MEQCAKLFSLIVIFAIFGQAAFMLLLYLKNYSIVLEPILVGASQRLVDFTDFQYVIRKDHLCDATDTLLLVIISSAPGNIVKRDTIRATWGQKRNNIKFVFNLGYSDRFTNEAIETEDSQHNDIIQGNFIDTYRNLTYKSTLAVKYAVDHCPSAKFILKCDDDVFVNTPLLVNFLHNDLNPLNLTNSILCVVRDKAPVIRNPNSKWYVPYEEYPGKFYPRYCTGMIALMTPDVALNLYKRAQETTFFWIDDVFLTGFVAKKISDLQFFDIKMLTLVKKEIENPKFLFGSYDITELGIRLLWRYVNENPVEKSVFPNLTTEPSST